jgi:uncharacterized protein (DUF4415 family)
MSGKSNITLTAAELAEIRKRRAKAARLVQKALETMTDEEDARLTAAAQADPDNPPITDEQWSRMRPAHEVHPHLARMSLLRRRGRPKLASPKQQVTLRLDSDVLQHFRAGGAGWQTAINETLRKAIGRGAAKRGQAAKKAGPRKARATRSAKRGKR